MTIYTIGDLECFMRGNGYNVQPPGCSGTPYAPGSDYCIDPMWLIGWVDPYYTASVTLYGFCSVAAFSISKDDGITFVNEDESLWNGYSFNITNVNDSTVLRVSCSDDGSGGGLIGSITFQDTVYSTSNPLEDGVWRAVFSSDNELTPLVYTEQNDSASDAQWVWNRMYSD